MSAITVQNVEKLYCLSDIIGICILRCKYIFLIFIMMYRKERVQEGNLDGCERISVSWQIRVVLQQTVFLPLPGIVLEEKNLAEKNRFLRFY